MLSRPSNTGRPKPHPIHNGNGINLWQWIDRATGDQFKKSSFDKWDAIATERLGAEFQG